MPSNPQRTASPSDVSPEARHAIELEKERTSIVTRRENAYLREPIDEPETIAGRIGREAIPDPGRAAKQVMRPDEVSPCERIADT